MRKYFLQIAFLLSSWSPLLGQCLDVNISTTEESCAFSCDGMAALGVSGGSGGPYSYQWWPNTDTTAMVFNLCQGTYLCTISDNNGCDTIVEIPINGPNPLWTTALAFNDDCGDCNGVIEVIASGGTPPYTYEWNGSWGNGNNVFFDVCPGVYDIIITDANGCVEVTTVFLDPDNNPLSIDANVTDTDCNQSNGAIDLEVIFGDPSSLLYSWTGPSGFSSNQEDISGLSPGDYTVFVTTASGCSGENTFTVEETNSFLAFADIQITDATTCGVCDGQAVVNSVTGGTPPYQYDWYDSDDQLVASEDNFTGCPGEYRLVITDQVGCESEQVVIIGPFIQIDAGSMASDCNEQTGSAFASVAGAADPLFVWNTGDTGTVIDGLLPDWYSVTVTDQSNGCFDHVNVYVPYDPSCRATISGYVYRDSVGDCMPGNGAPVHFALLELSTGDRVYADQDGYYEFEVDSLGDYTVEIISTFLNGPVLCDNILSVNVANFDVNYGDNNFYAEPNDYDDLIINIWSGVARPGFDQRVTVRIVNSGNHINDALVTLAHDSIQMYSYSAPSWSSPPLPQADYDPATNTIQWFFTDLAVNDVIYFYVYLKTPVGTPIGTVVAQSASIGPTDDDNNLTNNQSKTTRPVTNAYDPNDKRFQDIPMDEDGIGYSSEDWVSYRIRFQNTGNDTAFTVVIRDTLSDYFDLNTLQPEAGTHSFRADIVDGNILEFWFENIYLPDSSVNFDGSQGAVDFRVKLNPGIPYGTAIPNHAGIYFDFNKPVITNTATIITKDPNPSILGTVLTENGNPVPSDAQILLSGGADVQQFVQTDGAFELANLQPCEDYAVSVYQNSNAQDGVTTFDLSLIQRHILNIDPLTSPYKIIAADANNSGHVTVADVVEIRKLILNITDEYPNNTSWRFVPVDSSIVIQQPSSTIMPFSEVVNINNLIKDTEASFIGIKIGDVSDSFLWEGSTDERNQEQGLNFYTKNITFEAGEIVRIPIFVKDYEEMAACQFTLSFNSEILSYVGMAATSNSFIGNDAVGTQAVKQGLITFGWFHEQVTNWPDGEPLFYLTFEARGKGELVSILSMYDNPTNALAFKEDGFILIPELDIHLSNTFKLMSISPNPFNEETIVRYFTSKPGEINWRVVGAGGKVYVSEEATNREGPQQIRIDRQALGGPGVYWLIIESDEGRIVERIILL